MRGSTPVKPAAVCSICKKAILNAADAAISHGRMIHKKCG